MCILYCGNYVLFLLEFLFLLLFCGVALDPAPGPGPGTAPADTGVADPALTPAVDDHVPDHARLIIHHGDTGPATRSRPDLMVLLLPLASRVCSEVNAFCRVVELTRLDNLFLLMAVGLSESTLRIG